MLIENYFPIPQRAGPPGTCVEFLAIFEFFFKTLHTTKVQLLRMLVLRCKATGGKTSSLRVFFFFFPKDTEVFFFFLIIRLTQTRDKVRQESIC